MINQERLYNRILELGQIGLVEGEGVTCVAFSEEENEAIELVKKYMSEAGLSVRMDAAGNILGRREGTDPKAPVVMTGSHIDPVYNGGMFDGRLGVIAGIEVVQAMNENGVVTKHPIEVCIYRDEEGVRLPVGFSGASRKTGVPRDLILDSVDKDGISLREMLKDSGIDPERIEDARLPKGYAKAHIELHVEQGVVLESKGLSVGVVTGICGQVRGEFILKGQAAHAGTTPMDLRYDSLTAAAEILLEIEKETKTIESAVATVGKISVFPSGVNIVPGMTKFSLDVRHQKAEIRDALFERILEKGKGICEKRGIGFEFKLSNKVIPRDCSIEIQDVIEKACDNLNIPTMKMASGAGHDSSHFTDFCDMGMIFVRSKDGISHNPAEYSTKEDCADGANVLYQTLLSLAK